jgi:hypothetical protein
MKNSPISVSILTSADSYSHAILVWQERDGDIYAYVPTSVDNGEARWGWALVEEGTTPPPSFPLPISFMKRGLVQDLVDEIAKDMGIVAQVVRESQTLLDMKNEHLADLQKILFGSDWVEIQRGKPTVLEDKE